MVGYHGAGFANVVFCPNGTTVVEVSTFMDVNHSRTWRANMPAISRWGSFNVQPLWIPLRNLLETNKAWLHVKYNFTHFSSLHHGVPDRIIKELPKISLTVFFFTDGIVF